MYLDPSLKAAIYAVDLSTDSYRRAALALAIILIEKITYAEENELDWLDIFLSRYDDEFRAQHFKPYEATIFALSEARKTLYSTYDFNCFRRLGIQSYLLNIGALKTKD